MKKFDKYAHSFVYAIADSSGVVRYVGSSGEPYERFKKHKHGDKFCATRKLNLDGARLLLIECVRTRVNARAVLRRERYWIKKLAERFDLVNCVHNMSRVPRSNCEIIGGEMRRLNPTTRIAT